MLLPFAVIATILTSCHSQQTTSLGSTTFGSKSDSVFFSLQRTPCFGKCPAYTVRIDADGSAHYTGRSHAPREGEFIGRVDKATMQALYDRASAIGFFAFQDKYDGPVTDLPSTIIRVNANGTDKKVVGRVDTPRAFKPFAAFADSLLGHVQWEKVADPK
ncbi:MAG: hypothetical protein KA791_06750 [Flavobacteriales bacterium]|nr:hypothetical protein [Flavobacteriales bacterium]